MPKAKLAPKPAPSLSVVRLLEAPRAKVFKAWTDPRELRKWWGPEGYSCPSAEVDLRVGGRYRLGFQSEGGDPFHVGGVYREIVRPAKLVFSWKWEGGESDSEETVVTVHFREAVGGTEIEIVHEMFATAKSRNSHKQGWTGCLDKLEKRFA